MAQALLPWTEKYRPRKICEISHQDEVKKTLTRVVETGHMPHMLFYGPPGTGKTSAAVALSHEVFGPEEYKNRVLELNASDDRGINVVRENIKNYTKTTVAKGKINPQTGRPLPPWKLVVLDEADLMTTDAQSALRRIIEAYSKNTRFIIICNYVHKIIDPIFSRCSRYRFQPISVDAQTRRLRHICQNEGLEMSDGAMVALLKISEGDLRRAVTIVQTASSLHSRFTEECIFEVSGYPPKGIIEDVFNKLRRCASVVDESLQNIIDDGWDIGAVITEFLRMANESMDLSDAQKAEFAVEVAIKDVALLQGASESLQLKSLGYRLNSICGVHIKA